MAINKPLPSVPGSTAFKGGLGEFAKEAWVEVTKKTTWPTKPELIRSTSVVLAAIVAVSFYLAFVDLMMSRVTALIFASR
ncbi:MAG TPA: preprotein translocase subunit SecE [Armatimonadota bacterium]